jgi:hypothetical protein
MLWFQDCRSRDFFLDQTMLPDIWKIRHPDPTNVRADLTLAADIELARKSCVPFDSLLREFVNASSVPSRGNMQYSVTIEDTTDQHQRLIKAFDGFDG